MAKDLEGLAFICSRNLFFCSCLGFRPQIPVMSRCVQSCPPTCPHSAGSLGWLLVLSTALWLLPPVSSRMPWWHSTSYLSTEFFTGSLSSLHLFLFSPPCPGPSSFHRLRTPGVQIPSLHVQARPLSLAPETGTCIFMWMDVPQGPQTQRAEHVTPPLFFLACLLISISANDIVSL